MQRELLEQHSRNPIFSDVVYVSGISGERIPGHRIVQASSSHFFAEMFSTNPDQKVFQLPRPIQPITQPYVFDKSLIPSDPTKDEKADENKPKDVAGANATNPPPANAPKPTDPKAIAPLKPGLPGNLLNKIKDDMVSLSERPPASLDPTRSILSLTYVLQQTEADKQTQQQNNPLSNQTPSENSKFSMLNRLSPPITQQNCLIFYTLACSLKLKALEEQLLEYISQYLLTPTSSCAIFLESSKFDIPDLKKHALEIISQNFNDVIGQVNQKKYLLRLSYDYFKELVSKNDLWIDSEDKILDLVLDYIKEREELGRRPEEIAAEELENARILAEQELAKATAAGTAGQPPKPVAVAPNTAAPGQPAPAGLVPVPEDSHKNFVDLEKEAKARLKRYKLNEKEKKELLLLLRFKFISHEKLLSTAKVKHKFFLKIFLINYIKLINFFYRWI